jgi:hypothetical protein
MIHDDDLSFEELCVSSRGVFGVGGNITSLDVSDRKTFYVETNIVSGDGLSDLFVMHFD